MQETGKIKITILGSGTCVPSLERGACSVLISQGDSHILVDAGPGTMRQLLKAGVHINDIDMVLLSHFHLDHCSDLAPFIFATKYPGFDRNKKLILAAGTGIKNFYDSLNHVYRNHLEMPENSFDIIELEPGDATGIGDIRISCCRVCHKPESLAYRFEDLAGYSCVYSGDTDYSEALVELASDADILICESAMPDELKVPGHLTPSMAGEIASKANVKKLVLTHLYPECEKVDILTQCRKTYSGEIEKAADLLTF